MTVDAKTVKKLRDMTQAGMMECKKALTDAGGDIEKAKLLVRERGQARIDKKDRAIEAGWIGTYVHKGKLGAMIEVGCNTDFVARTDEFQKLAYDLAKAVVALKPECLSSDDIKAEEIEEEKKKYSDTIKGKPPEIQEKIIISKLAEAVAIGKANAIPVPVEPEVTKKPGGPSPGSRRDFG